MNMNIDLYLTLYLYGLLSKLNSFLQITIQIMRRQEIIKIAFVGFES